MNDIILIMAGGLGKRMCSNKPKVLHKVLDKPMLIHVIETSIKLEPLQIYVIVGKYLPEIKDTINKYKLLDKVKFIKQNEPLGTGHAIQCSKNIIKNHNGKVLILSGDVPLIKTNTLKQMLSKVKYAKIMTTIRDNPCGYGRVIIKNGIFQKIIEEKDCSDQQKKCKQTNTGIYVFNIEILCRNISYLNNNNKQKEYYLTDIFEIIKKNDKINIEIMKIPANNQIELIGVNTKEQLNNLNNMLIRNI